VLAGDSDGVLLLAALREVYPLSGALVTYCSGITDAELDERLVLNMYLMGLDRDAALSAVSQPAGTLSREAEAMRSPSVAARQQARRLDLIDRVWAEPAVWVARTAVTHVILPVGSPGPGRLSPSLGSNALVFRGRYWQVWQLGFDH
jgi:hypothetical protein